MEFQKCRRLCKWRSSCRGVNGCDYLYLTGKVRGCPAGKDCTRFEAGPRATQKADSLPVEIYTEEERDIMRYLTEQKLKFVKLDGVRRRG